MNQPTGKGGGQVVAFVARWSLSKTAAFSWRKWRTITSRPDNQPTLTQHGAQVPVLVGAFGCRWLFAEIPSNLGALGVCVPFICDEKILLAALAPSIKVYNFPLPGRDNEVINLICYQNM